MAPVSHPDGREQLIHLLTDAAELEHSILCSYFHAALSLKGRVDDGQSRREAEAVAQWHRVVLTTAVEEMDYRGRCFPRHRC